MCLCFALIRMTFVADWVLPSKQPATELTLRGKIMFRWTIFTRTGWWNNKSRRATSWPLPPPPCSASSTCRHPTRPRRTRRCWIPTGSSAPPLSSWPKGGHSSSRPTSLWTTGQKRWMGKWSGGPFFLPVVAYSGHRHWGPFWWELRAICILRTQTLGSFLLRSQSHTANTDTEVLSAENSEPYCRHTHWGPVWRDFRVILQTPTMRSRLVRTQSILQTRKLRFCLLRTQSHTADTDIGVLSADRHTADRHWLRFCLLRTQTHTADTDIEVQSAENSEYSADTLVQVLKNGTVLSLQWPGGPGSVGRSPVLRHHGVGAAGAAGLYAERGVREREGGGGDLLLLQPHPRLPGPHLAQLLSGRQHGGRVVQAASHQPHLRGHVPDLRHEARLQQRRSVWRFEPGGPGGLLGGMIKVGWSLWRADPNEAVWLRWTGWSFCWYD